MNRTKKTHVYSVFFRLANLLGKTVYFTEKEFASLKKQYQYFTPPDSVTHSYKTVGAWHLDFNNGTRIAEIDNEQGGISYPLGTTLFTATEFYYAVHFALRALDIKMEAK